MHFARERLLKFGFLFAAALVAGPPAACASEPRLRPASLDPSNPDAAEAPASTRSDLTLSGAPAAPQQRAIRGHDAGTATPAEGAKPGPSPKGEHQPATIYTCPMHPEVVADQPGRCPKCGMKLVPKEPPAGKK